MKDKDKTFDKFDKKLNAKINSASTAKSWSDLLPIMKDIHSILNKHNECDFNKITNKQILAKRLSQGLNPECPSGLHEVTLEVYELILKNITNNYGNKLMENLYLYAYGLFPFFPNASIQNKKIVLEKIVEPIFLNLNKDELKLCLPGLLSSLIPGLDDNNEQNAKLIYKTFDKFISINNGQLEQYFFGVYWMLLLRCQHLRNSGIKYLIEKTPKYSDLIQLEDNKRKEIIEKQYPNINITVVNALCEIIKENDIPTIRNGMDFIMTRLPLTKKNIYINDEAKVNLIISGLQLLIRNESSTIRRLKGWILGINDPDDEVNFNSEDMKYKMNLVIEAFKIIFDLKKEFVEEELLNNIKIIHRLLENEQEFMNLILPDMAYIILKNVVNYWEIDLDCSENVDDNEIINQIKKFFELNDICFNYLWKSLAESIKKITQENDDLNLDKKINEILLPLKFCLLYIDMKSNEQRIKYYFPIITNLLDIIKKIELKRDQFKQLRQVILIVLAFVKTLQDDKFYEQNEEEKNDKAKNQKEKDNKNLVDYQLVEKVRDKEDQHSINLRVRNSVISLINNDEEDLKYDVDNNNVYNISEISSLSHILKNDKNIQMIEELSKNISKFQDYYIDLLREYLKIENQISKFEIFLFKQCTELIIRLQEYSQEKENEIPKWVKYLEKIIFTINNKNILLSIEAANVFIDLNLSNSLKNNIFLKIKNNFKSEEIDKEIIEQPFIEEIIQKMKVQPICYELLLGKFYLISNNQSNLTMIMELLIKMSILDKNKFIQIINNTFKIEENLIQNIKLFSNFWKLANENYPDEKLFQKGECIFEMLDFLDSKNPLLRNLSKNWLNQTNQRYDKIIDPILLVLLDKKFSFEKNKETNSYYFLKEFDSSTILDAFIKLKNIILNCSIVEFFEKKKPNEEIISNISFEYFDKNDMHYLQILISISLHYIRTKALDNLNDKFKKEVLSINAASCEFLEFLLNNIEKKQLSFKNIQIISKAIIDLLNFSLRDKDEVMPAQLLDVLNSLYFRLCKNPENKTNYLSLINNGDLGNALVLGMTSEHYYIREHFISFAKTCVETFISIISIEDKNQLQNFYDLCKRFIGSLSLFLSKRSNIDKLGRDDSEKFSHYDKKNNEIIFKNYLEEYKEYKTFDESDVLSILKGINDIISFCFKNKILEKNNQSGSKENVKIIFIPIPLIKKKALRVKMDYSGDWRAYKKELANNLKTNNAFVSFFTTIIDITDERPNAEISDMPTHLYSNQIFNLLNSFLSIWINQSDKYEINDYCLNSNGILAPTKIDSWKDLSEKQIKFAKDTIKSNPIKQYIIRIAMNLFITDSIKFMENILQLWCEDNSNNYMDQYEGIDKQIKLSIIELLISMDIPLDVILFCLGTIIQNKIVINKEKYIKNQKEKCYETPIKQSIYEAQIFHFIYSYILLNPNKYTKENNENDIIEIWKEIITILNNSINGTKILYSFCWMYEIIELASEKFDIQNIDNKEIKNGIENVFNVITNKLINAVFSEKYDSKYIIKNKLVLPFLPHVYKNLVNILYKDDNLYHKNLEGSKSRNKKNNDGDKNFFSKTSEPISTDKTLKKRSKTTFGYQFTLKDINNKFNTISSKINLFYREYINSAKTSSEYNEQKNPDILDPQKLNGIYRDLSFIILKEDFYLIIKNLFNDNINTAKKYYTDIVNKLLFFIKRTEKGISLFRSEYASEFLLKLMENTPKNIVTCGKGPIMEYINSNLLFNATPTELHRWRVIVSHLSENYSDILVDLLKDIQDTNIFKKKTDEDKKRILRRVSFVIYSCEKDKFSRDFGLIKSKAKDLLSEYNDNNSLEDEIFLIMRMLFLRFSHDGVMQMIRDLWPIIFTELIQNIKDEARKNKFSLILESFKFVELLSLINIEEFSLYQWIFMLDTFDMNELNLKKENSLMEKLISNNEKIFKPLSLEVIGKEDLNINESWLEGKHKGKDQLYIKARNHKELKKQILQFFYSIGDMNSYKVEANYVDLEEDIESDFISIGTQNNSKVKV